MDHRKLIQQLLLFYVIVHGHNAKHLNQDDSNSKGLHFGDCWTLIRSIKQALNEAFLENCLDQSSNGICSYKLHFRIIVLIYRGVLITLHHRPETLLRGPGSHRQALLVQGLQTGLSSNNKLSTFSFSSS